MTWWEWLAVAIWGPTTAIGVLMIASLPVAGLWRRVHAGRLAGPIRAQDPAGGPSAYAASNASVNAGWQTSS